MLSHFNAKVQCDAAVIRELCESRDSCSDLLFSRRLAPMWQQSGTLLFCSCHGIAGFLEDELQI